MVHLNLLQLSKIRKCWYEVDLVLSYDYTEDVTIGANIGWFFPGSGFDKANKDAASQAIVTVGVDFLIVALLS